MCFCLCSSDLSYWSHIVDQNSLGWDFSVSRLFIGYYRVIEIQKCAIRTLNNLVGYLLRFFQRTPILTKLHSKTLLEIIFYAVKLGQCRRWRGQHACNTRNKHNVMLDTTATFLRRILSTEVSTFYNCLQLSLKRLLKSNLEELTERLALKQRSRVLNQRTQI